MTDGETFLSEREKEAWKKTRKMSREEAADAMNIACDTLETFLDRVFRKRKKARQTLEWLDGDWNFDNED